jgi:hypothetical protein
MALHIHQCLDGMWHIIDLSMKHYDKTGDINALKIAFDGYVSFGKMLRQVALT